ncbi:MAG: hypothetical protein Kow0080_28240 [Candidatus Promineifilaceae bacterium]
MVIKSSQKLFEPNRIPWRLFIIGVVVALSVAALLMAAVLQASMEEIAALVTTLSVTSLLSLGLGYGLYRRGWARSPSLNLTLIFAYGWAGLATLFNVWVMSQQMFASEHDLLLSGVLLLFAAIIATTFGVFVAASLTDSLRQMAKTAQKLADGDLSARVVVNGRDEVAALARVFNEMADQLQAAADHRDEVEQMRRNLIAWTSHDLRTPLTSIRALVEALHDGMVTDPETVQRYYRTIRADVIALNTLIDDLFELAQLDTGGLVLELSPHTVSDLISDAVEGFRPLAERRGVTLVGEVVGEPGVVMMNLPKISRVLSNLLSNALRYVPDGGQVQVTAVSRDGGVELSVADNGPGFQESDLPHLFEMFYRGEEARSRKTGGAGLGLAIARGIVAAHNGRIWAKNGENGGAVVGFFLPGK